MSLSQENPEKVKIDTLDSIKSDNNYNNDNNQKQADNIQLQSNYNQEQSDNKTIIPESTNDNLKPESQNLEELTVENISYHTKEPSEKEPPTQQESNINNDSQNVIDKNNLSEDSLLNKNSHHKNSLNESIKMNIKTNNNIPIFFYVFRYYFESSTRIFSVVQDSTAPYDIKYFIFKSSIK